MGWRRGTAALVVVAKLINAEPTTGKSKDKQIRCDMASLLKPVLVAQRLYITAERTCWDVKAGDRIGMRRIKSRHVLHQVFPKVEFVGLDALADALLQFVTAVVVMLLAVPNPDRLF